MTSLLSFRRLSVLLAGLATAWAVQASPAVYLLNVTSGAPPAQDLSNVDFAVIYEDLDGNMLFSLNELLVFQDIAIPGGPFFDLLAIPDSAQSLASNAANEWRFTDGVVEAAFGDTRFTPFVELLAAPLPVGSTAWLALPALLGGWAVRRRRR